MSQEHGRGVVPVGPLRDAVIASGRPWASIARDLGWMRTRKTTWTKEDGTVSVFRNISGDGRRVKRVLGISPYRKDGESTYNKRMGYASAVALCHVLNLDPVDVDF